MKSDRRSAIYAAYDAKNFKAAMQYEFDLGNLHI
jgi:hypothetical protein